MQKTMKFPTESDSLGTSQYFTSYKLFVSYKEWKTEKEYGTFIVLESNCIKNIWPISLFVIRFAWPAYT